jgi:CheY-like chemotaxis protein
MTGKHKLLLVEDEKELIGIVESYFRDEGYEVRVASNGVEAMTVLAHFIPDIIVSDVRMGPMDGFEMVEAIRTNQHLKSIPVIFLTIMDDRSSFERAKKLDVVEYMTKPFEVEELHAKVVETLAKKN